MSKVYILLNNYPLEPTSPIKQPLLHQARRLSGILVEWDSGGMSMCIMGRQFGDYKSMNAKSSSIVARECLKLIKTRKSVYCLALQNNHSKNEC